jgi:CheY-like chemotaxis protein
MHQQPSGNVPTGSDQLRVEYDVAGLSEAVALASELQVLPDARVQIRPTCERLLGRQWKVTLTIPPRTHGGPVGVLIVDDSAPFRRAARDLLQRRGYLVVGEADTVAGALDAVRRISPDALLVDVGLPDGCGFELARVLVRAQPDLAVLLMSADDPPAGTERLCDSGARGFVLKSGLAAAPLERFLRTPSP